MSMTHGNTPKAAATTARAAHYQRLAGDAVTDDWVEREVRRASAGWPAGVHAFTEAQIVAAANLAADLYATAAAHGVDRATMDGVTNVITAAIDGIWARDRR